MIVIQPLSQLASNTSSSPGQYVASPGQGKICDRASSSSVRRMNSPPTKGHSHRRRVPSWGRCHVICLVAALLGLLLAAEPSGAEPAGSGSVGSRPPVEYQLVGQVSQEVHLPCLIGFQLYCGEPYFIAWYKLNASTKTWLRIEHNSPEEPDGRPQASEIGGGPQEAGGTPVNERAHFVWGRPQQQQQQQQPRSSSWRAACQQPIVGLTALDSAKLESIFDCAQLTINRLELADEGQYKCEITFSESLDFVKCPTTTHSRLSVIARPNEPQLLINGRPALPQPVPPTFKEGAQVKLECLSSGGRPAPRIEWLNVTGGTGGGGGALEQPEVQLMRAHWPQKKSSALIEAPASVGAPTPITTSSVTISLTRHDLNSRFVCMVLPQAPSAGGHQPPVGAANLDQLIRSPAYLAALLVSTGGAAAEQQPQPQQQNAPMFKWIKLDVQVKPSSVALVVRDLEASPGDAPLEPVQWPQQQQQQLLADPQQLAGQQLIKQHLSPFYSLAPNRLYALQCIVDGSRPQSQLTWFNRTAPISVDTRQLNGSADFLLPASPARQHRLSSFVRTLGHSNGTFRSVATLLLTTSVWDNFEELFCRVSNEAFQYDELLQVAPIISARLYVNYPPFAWIEAPGPLEAPLEPATRPQSGLARPLNEDPDPSSSLTLSRDLGSELVLRCSLAANPLSQNTILQFEWLKDGRKLSAPSGGGSKSAQQQQQPSRIHIEKANHLHMPATLGALSEPSPGSGPKSAAVLGNQLVASSKLISSSSLTIGSLAKSDSGLYSCHYKLIPAPSPAGSGGLPSAQQQSIKITSGQANQTVQVNVIEAKPRAPSLRILSSRGLLVYGLRQQSPSDGPGAKPTARGGQQPNSYHLLTVVAQPDSSISLRCHLAPSSQSSQLLTQSPGVRSMAKKINAQAAELAHKILWHLNGVPIHSSGPQDTYYNFTPSASHLAAASTSGGLVGLLSCALHFLESGGSPDNFHGGQMRSLPSSNQIELRLKVGPKLVTKRELMPPMRSFSELELNANSANKLRLACMAKCEPVCAIDWYLNRRPLEVTTGGVTQPTSVEWSSAAGQPKWNHQRDQQQQQLTNNATAEPIVLSRSSEAVEPDEELGLGLAKVEILVHGGPNSSASFSWLKATGLSFGRSDLSPAAKQQLRHEALETLHQLPIEANVYSRLELTYGQIAKLLAASGDHQVQIKCRLNPMLNGQTVATAGSRRSVEDEISFSHSLVEPMRWFPSESSDNEPPSETNDQDNFLEQHPFALTNEPLNLTELEESKSKKSDIENYSSTINSDDKANNSPWTSNWPLDHNNINSNSKPAPTDFHARRLLSSGLQHARETSHGAQRSTDWSLSSNEIQINILLDRAPKGVSVSFAGIVSTDQEASGVTISEGQLIELMDPNRAAPLLWCQTIDNPYPKPQFRWTFIDSNRTEHLLAEDGPYLNLRNIISSRQRQLNVDPASAYGVEVVASIVGNYTCSVGNIHGTKSASLPIQIQGRPLCKLTLGAEYLGPDNELLANLRCLIYSAPSLLETVWFRGSQQLAVNKSSLDTLAILRSTVSLMEMPIVILNKQQDFMLMDLVNQAANFKCIARNSMGYSEACDMGQTDKLNLLNTFKPIGGLGFKVPPITIIPTLAGSIKSDAALNFLSNGTIDLNQPAQSMIYMPWFLITVCAVALSSWLLVLIIRCTVRRCYSNSKLGAKHNHNTSWRFNPTRSSSNSGTMGLPFQSKTICVNYYGGSNGDSEHDMMQSCSQSSHYEEFVSQNHQLQQQQPVHFNGHSTTLTRRTLKPSLSTSSTGESSTGSRQAQQLIRLGDKTREFNGPIPNKQPKLAATMRESLAANHHHHHATGRYPTSSGSTHTSNVPLVNGTLNSRINLDQQTNGQHYRFQGNQQQTFGQPRNEPIYDDVIYNQMIL